MRYALIWIGGAAFIALLAVSGVLTTFATAIAVPQAADLVQANTSALAWGAARSLVFVIAVAAVLLMVRDDKIPGRIAVWLVAAIVAADLWSIERLYWQFSQPASVVYASDSAIRYLQSQAQPGRVLTVGQGPGAMPQDPELDYDGLMIHRIRQALGYHGNQIHRYEFLAGRDEGYRAILSSPQVWRLLNVQYLLTNLTNLQTQIPGFRQILGPVRDAAGSTLYLYRLPGDNPVAWTTPVSVKAGDDQTLATVTDPRFDPTAAAVYDSAAPVAAEHVTTLPAPLGIGVTATRYEPGHLAFKLDKPAPAGSSLIVSENYFPGWVATVDGKPAVAARVDYTLIGVPLTAGATTVELTFTSHIDEVGKLITFCAAAIALVWWLVELILSRRRHG